MMIRVCATEKRDRGQWRVLSGLPEFRAFHRAWWFAGFYHSNRENDGQAWVPFGLHLDFNGTLIKESLQRCFPSPRPPACAVQS